MNQGFLVEQFGRVRSHQSYALNFHLNKTVAAFDREYSNSIGRLGSSEHRQSRREYVEFVALQLLDLFKNKDGVPLKITTETHTDLPSGFIEVNSRSRFDNLRS